MDLVNCSSKSAGARTNCAHQRSHARSLERSHERVRERPRKHPQRSEHSQRAQVLESVKTINIDKCEGTQLILNRASTDAEV